jgi:hypothetical protein
MFALRISLKTPFLLAAFSLLSAASAEEAPKGGKLLEALDLPKDRIEFTNGFDAAGSAWSAYGSAVISFMQPLSRDGWRLKLSGVYSRYSYERRDSTICKKIHDAGQTDPNPILDKICDSIASNPPQGGERDQIAATLQPYGLAIDGDQVVAIIPHQVTRTQLTVAPGYQASVGALVLKAYLGLGFEKQEVTPGDPDKALIGSFWGAQSWVEAWLPLGESFWLSADGSYFTATSRYSVDVKFGYAPAEWLAFGPELAAFGDEEDASGRAGAFVRINAAGMETTISGGISGAYKADPSAYGSASLYMKF